MVSLSILVLAAQAVHALSSRPQASADVATDPATGHTYVRSPEPLTAFEALGLAREIGAQLVSITSAEEETFLLENFGASEGFWIGLEFPRERWASGEALVHTHWFRGEPSGGAAEPFTVLNWGEPGGWGDVSGDAEKERFRALFEFEKGVEIPRVPAAPADRSWNRGVLLLAVQGLRAKDLDDPKLPNLSALWERAAWTEDAGGDASGDPLANLGLLLWGVGSAKSRLLSSRPSAAARNATENLLARLERALPSISTASLLDDPSLTGILVDGRVDVRVSNASARRGGSAQPAREALALATPACVVAAWTNLGAAADEQSEAERQKDLAAIDQELGALLAGLRERPRFAEEDWWIALAGLEPVVDKKGEERSRTAVPLGLVAAGLAPGEILRNISLADVVPSALAHLGLEARRGWGFDGRALDLGRAPAFGEDLVVNGGAEAQFGWVQEAGVELTGWRNFGGFQLGRHDATSGGSEARGTSYFQGRNGERARMEQTLDLTPLAAELDRGSVRFRLSAALGVQKPGATVRLQLEALSAQKKPLASFELVAPPAAKKKEPPTLGVLPLSTDGRLPRRTRAVRLTLAAEGTEVGAVQADEIALVLERD